MLIWTGSRQLSAVRSLLETMLPDKVSRALVNAPVEDEEIDPEEDQATARSKEWFNNNQGASLEDVATELGFTMDEIRHAQEPG